VRGIRPIPTLVLLLAAAAPLGARAQSVIDLELLVFEGKLDGMSQGWTFELELEGTGLGAVTLTPPGQSAIPIVDGDATDREFQSATFASFAALQLSFPAGSYAIDVNAGAITLMLDFNPVAPDGGGFFTFPTHGSSTLDTTPTFSVDNSACTNCNVQALHVEDTGFTSVDLDYFEFAPFSSSIPLASFEPNEGGAGPITELPFDDYETCVSLAVATIESDFMNGGQTFELIRAAVDNSCIRFTVPEPGGSVLGATALVTLAALARRRRRICSRSLGC
jgi:MYXO-CTERM domain-containing protein